MRMWELQRFTAGGVVRTIGTGVYHDELCKGVEVGVSRDAVLAAIQERAARASEWPERDRRPVAAGSAWSLPSGARGSVWPNGPLDHD